MEEKTKDLSEYLGALRRRKTAVLSIAGVLFVVSVLVAWLLPPVYQSTSTILIEEQEIPPDLVRSTITTYAWQRIQTISQRVMTRNILLEIVDKYELYASKRKRETSEEIVERIRNDIRLEAISADVIDPRSGRPMPATIAFTLSYQGVNPAVTQKVANELTTLYLNENLKSRTEKAAETYDFLTEEAKKMGDHIGELETKLAEFKEKNVNQLPELAQLNMSLMDRTERELMDTFSQIRLLEERKFYLEGQLAQMNPMSPMFSTTGERILDPNSRLKAIRSELASALARYSPDHPDVQRLRRELEGLEISVNTPPSSQDQAKELARIRSDLAAASEKYSNEHPDVIRMTRQIESLEAHLKEANAQTPERQAAEKDPDNPAYLSMRSQLEGVNSELRSVSRKRDDLKAKLVSYEQRLVQTPQVEREYLNLKRDYDNSQIRYREVKAKQMEAEIGQQLEKDRKGERFSLIDPPQLPEKPVKPNRIAIIFLGLVLSIGGGLGYALVAESLDRSVHSARHLVAVLGSAPLSIIPYIENSADIGRREKTRKLAMSSALAAVVAGVVLVQFFWIPWDVLWLKGLRVLGGMIGS